MKEKDSQQINQITINYDGSFKIVGETDDDKRQRIGDMPNIGGTCNMTRKGEEKLNKERMEPQYKKQNEERKQKEQKKERKGRTNLDEGAKKRK